jgi:hypothetical protein
MNDVGNARRQGAAKSRGGSPAGLADKHHGLVRRKLARIETRKRNIDSARNVPALEFVRLAHIHDMAAPLALQRDEVVVLDLPRAGGPI